MRAMLTASLTCVALAWVGNFAHAQGPGCCGPACAPADCCPCSKTYRIVEEEEKYCVDVKKRNEYKVKEKVFINLVPCTRSVPVCVPDACGGTHTEYKQETVLNRVRTTYLELTPPCEEYSCKPEERIRKCTKVYMPPCCPQH